MHKAKKIINHATSFGGKAPKVLTRFFRYTLVGGIGSLMDIIIFAIFHNLLGIYYLAAVTISYISSATFAYVTNRAWGFKETERTVIGGYIYYITVGIFGIIFTLLLMYCLVEKLELTPLTSRLISLVIVGIYSFTMNYLFTFKMRGK